MWVEDENDVTHYGRGFTENDVRASSDIDKSTTNENDSANPENNTKEVVAECKATRSVEYRCPEVPDKKYNLGIGDSKEDSVDDVLPTRATSDSEEHIYDVPIPVESETGNADLPGRVIGYERLSQKGSSKHYQTLCIEDTVFYDSFDIFAHLEETLNNECLDSQASSDLEELTWNGDGEDCALPPPPNPPTPPPFSPLDE